MQHHSLLDCSLYLTPPFDAVGILPRRLDDLLWFLTSVFSVRIIRMSLIVLDGMILSAFWDQKWAGLFFILFRSSRRILCLSFCLEGSLAPSA